MQAKRLEMTQQEFQDFYVHDGWLYGDEIVEMKAADGLVNVICDMDSDKSQIVKIDTWFGTILIEYSVCPLMHAPRNITLERDLSLVNKMIDKDYNNIINDHDVSKFITNMISL